MSDRMALAVILFTAVCTASLLPAGHEAYRRLMAVLQAVLTAVLTAVVFPGSVRVLKRDGGEDRG